MAIRFELYSERVRRAAPGYVDDPYVYDVVPDRLREQIRQVLLHAFGNEESYPPVGPCRENVFWSLLERTFCREVGVSSIGMGTLPSQRVTNYMASCSDIDWLDLFELGAKAVDFIVKNPSNHDVLEFDTKGDGAIDELNFRLRRACLGYQFEGGQLVRIDSQVVHSEVVKPAIALLSKAGFEGANQEFMDAHAKYREGDHRGAVSQAANALESTFKAIFDKKGWAYNKGNRISDLVKVAKSNKLWPDYLDGSFDQLISTLQSGLPKIRDNDASHGQGSEVKVVPHYVAALALHLAASKIVFLVEAANS